MYISNLLVPVIGCMLLTFVHCSSANDKSKNNLGEISFSVTGKKEAQPYFEKGMLLLHSFEYDDAAEQFSKARVIDPGFTMAYWGEAMTYNHSLWRFQDYDQANAILNKLAPTPQERVATAKTELEKDFMKGINILYGKGSKTERDSSYAAYMGELNKKYTGNAEVASFYSIALIGSVPVGRNNAVYEQAAGIANEVLAKNPRHPGALHYLIHAYDDPNHASLALTTADAYSLVAPEAGHALHMPTHIYLALGMWDKVVSSNISSWQAGVNRKERKQLTNDALNYHGLHWLMYGYLQQGKKEEARKLVEDMKQYCTTLPSVKAREHMNYLKSTYLVETRDYTGYVAAIEFKLSGLNIATRAMNHFVNGMKAYYKNDAGALNNSITQMTGERLVDQERVAASSSGICGGVNGAIPNVLDVQQAEIMELELKAMQAWLKKDPVTTQRFLEQAVEMESKISYGYGPPTIVKPSFELYGEWLLEINKAREALQQFELSLKSAPNRLLSMKGKESALANK